MDAFVTVVKFTGHREKTPSCGRVNKQIVAPIWTWCPNGKNTLLRLDDRYYRIIYIILYILGD